MIGKIKHLLAVILRRYRWHLIAKIINEHNLQSYCEIGIAKCDTIKYLLKHCPSLKYVVGVDDYNLEHRKEQKQFTLRLVKQYENRFKFVEKSSEEAAEIIKSKFDIIFIDANHSYEACKQDIELWFSKVKEGGFLVGHDYSLRFIGVPIAVNEFIGHNRARFDLMLDRDDCWFIKNEPRDLIRQ